jgi:hypothetical protein
MGNEVVKSVMLGISDLIFHCKYPLKNVSAPARAVAFPHQGEGFILMKSRKRDEIRASSDEIFSLRLQMKLNPPLLSPRSGISSRRDFIHRRWIYSADGGFS